jgi:hypothetical protein
MIMQIILGTRNIRSSYRAGSLTAVGRELAKYNLHKVYSHPQCNLFIFFFSLSQHVSAVYGHHQGFLCQICFLVGYVPLLPSHMNAIGLKLKVIETKRINTIVFGYKDDSLQAKH